MNKKQIELLGIVAGIFSTIAFVPQIYQIYKTDNTSSFSYITIIVYLLGQFLWSIYGIINKKGTIVVFSVSSIIIYLLILHIKITHKKKNIN